MQANINSVVHEIQPPKGWEITDDVEDCVPATQIQINDSLKNQIRFHLPYIAHNVELYIDRVYARYDIIIPEAYISVDDDSTFCIVLLINEEYAHTPEFFGAKMYAEDFLTTIGAISMRYTFTVAKEYLKFNYIAHAHKPKYNYIPTHLLNDRLGHAL